ncbi:MAG: LysM peptidoglycan-binding domain-containing protein [Anaerolineae bacterium]|nr:LysM peptidoglycan-binding domain-containing protein [Anaerolineae bacterium]
MAQSRTALIAGLSAVGLVATLVITMAAFPVAAQDGNLLVNGSMEGGYSPQDGIPQIQMPNGWRAWWTEGGGADWANLRPEWSTSSASSGYGERVVAGDRAMRYFKGWGTFTAGAYQTVGGITPGTNLEFSAYGQSWSCLEWAACNEPRDAQGLPPRVWSTNNPGNVHMKIGIDPTGGTDPFSPNVVWSGVADALDNYLQFRVSATAQADRVTVFLYASQDTPAENQDAYWDEAVLRVGGAGGAASGGEGGAPAVSFGVAVIPTYPPQEDGRIIHTVRAGETLGGIAVAYGLESAQAVRDLNNLTGDIIYRGQELLVGYVEGASPDAESDEETGDDTEGEAGGAAVPGGAAAPGASGEADAEADAEGSAAAAAAATTGEICVGVYEDTNLNRTFEGVERRIGGAGVTLKKGEDALASYRTDGVSEPHCFDGLTPGDYTVEVTPPRAYSATTSAVLAVRVEAGASQSFDFGVARGVAAGAAGEVVPPAAEIEPTPAPVLQQPSVGNRILDFLSQWIGVIVLVLAGALVVLWLAWLRLRR